MVFHHQKILLPRICGRTRDVHVVHQIVPTANGIDVHGHVIRLLRQFEKIPSVKTRRDVEIVGNLRIGEDFAQLISGLAEITREIP